MKSTLRPQHSRDHLGRLLLINKGDVNKRSWVQETNHAKRAALQVRLKRLKFADRQAQLQVMVEREQSELMGMTDRAYKSIARQCVRQRLDKMRAVSHIDVSDIK